MMFDVDAYAEWVRHEHPNAALLHRHETGQCLKEGDCPYCEEEE